MVYTGLGSASNQNPVAGLSDAGEEAVEHVKHVSEITDPESFDKVDDSVFNDQNDGEAEAGTK